MTTETTTVVLRKMVASEGKVITDVATEELRSTVVYLAANDSEYNYKEIDADTPLPGENDE